MTKFSLAIVLSLGLLVVGCGSSHHFLPPTPQPSQVSVTVTPSTAQLTGGETVQFTATVANATNRSVNWRVSGGGTISSSGLYTAPQPVAANITDMVTATSVEDTTKSDSATVNFTPVSVSVTPQDQLVALTDRRQFTAEVTGSTNTAVTWSVSGDGCVGAACGLISSAGLYRAPWCVPVPGFVTVTATAVADPSKSASTVVTTANLGPTLSGSYAFLYSGVDLVGSMVQSAGHFLADNGQITSGLSDVVNYTTARTNVSFAGIYDNRCYARGVMSITDSGEYTHTYTYSLNADGSRGHFIEMNDTAGRGTGTLVRVASPGRPAVGNGGLGTFVFGFSGTTPMVFTAPSNPGSLPSPPLSIYKVGFAGQVTFGATGSVSGIIDANLAGTTYAASGLSGTYTFDSSTGRGTATFTAGVPLDDTYHLSFYPASDNEVFWMGLDAAPVAPRSQSAPIAYPVYGGIAIRQEGPFDRASLNAASVLHLTGVEAGTPDSDVLAGIIMPDGSGNISAGVLDENDDAVVSEYPSVTGTYTLDESSYGRGTLHLNLATGLTRDLTFYLVDTNKAFLLDGTDTDDAPNVGVGFLEPQVGGPFSNANFSGLYSVGTLSFPSPLTPVNAGVLIGDGQGALIGMGDTADIEGYHPATEVSGTYDIPESGRGNYVFMKFYMISPTKAIMFEANDSKHQPTVVTVEH